VTISYSTQFANIIPLLAISLNQFTEVELMTIKKIILYTVIISITGLAVYYFYPEKKLPENAQIDKILVNESKRQLLVYSNGTLLKTYRISLGRNPIGAKEFQGDNKTPEGLYFINDKNPYSGYHKNLGISYPNTHDIEHSKTLGKPVGGDIKIHGYKNGLGFIGKFWRWRDWTFGCIAMTNKDVDELYKVVKIGTIIAIKP
jgi:murein L,D-transpeptidase YafK